MPVRSIVVVGAGAAGLTLATLAAERAPHMRIRLLDAGAEASVASPDRTWCFWERDLGPNDGLLTAAWPSVRVIGSDARALDLDLAPLRYKMLSSTTYLERMTNRADAAGVDRRTVHVEDVWSIAGVGPRLRGHDAGTDVLIDDADVVYDTRPVTPLGGSVHLLQHFRGWFVRTQEPAFASGRPILMDFRTPQPRNAVSFGYVLPTSDTTALVEYTEFSREPLNSDAYDRALRDYTGRILGLPDFTVDATEQGAIPMTDAAFPVVAGTGVFRIGTAGGATRPSTGYTFKAALRQAEAVAEDLARGGDGVPPAAFGRRHLAMDRLMLQALDSGRVDGADFFMRLFSGQPAERVLRFLDGATTPAEDVAIMRTAPMAAMLRTLVTPTKR